MAADTAQHRWARIVKKMAETVESACSDVDHGMQKRVEGEKIRQEILLIRKEILHNDQLPPVNLHGDPDEQWYNKQLGAGSRLSWQASPWLFAECYLYRRVQALFSASVFWTTFDVFKAQKDDSLLASQKAVEGLCRLYVQGIGHNASETESADASYLGFVEALQSALWGNAIDLSLLSEPSTTEISALQEHSTFAAARSRIVDDDTSHVWSYIQSTAFRNGTGRVDIVLDNAGFELLTDLVLALYLLDQGIAQTVQLHAKPFPWFVSDVTPTDLPSLLRMLRSSNAFPVRQFVDPFMIRLEHALSSGGITIVQHWFWTTGSSFWEMPTRARDLRDQLASSDLVIFKGDLNYRKLTYDGLWPHATPFEDALGPLGRGSGIKILALRTNKADVCVGLESDGQVRLLDEAFPDKGWVRNGKHAVISFSSGS